MFNSSISEIEFKTQILIKLTKYQISLKKMELPLVKINIKDGDKKLIFKLKE